MFTSSTSAVAATVETDSRAVDEIDDKIAQAKTWPYDYPTELQAKGKSIRFRYHVTVDCQAEASFARILVYYRDHVLEMNKHCEQKFPYIKMYPRAHH